MTVAEELSQAIMRLTQANSDEPQPNAEWLLACVLNVTRTWLLAHPDYTLSEIHTYTPAGAAPLPANRSGPHIPAAYPAPVRPESAGFPPALPAFRTARTSDPCSLPSPAS